MGDEHFSFRFKRDSGKTIRKKNAVRGQKSKMSREVQLELMNNSCKILANCFLQKPDKMTNGASWILIPIYFGSKN